MSSKTKQPLRSGGLAGKLKAGPKQSPVAETQSFQGIAPEKGKWKFHPLYQTWRNIKCRCYVKSNKDYPNYGGRGIKVCERWKDFTAFAVDMWPRPSKDHTIDRIDSNRDYDPGNCRWATRLEQNLNTSQNHYAEHNGIRRTMSEWAHSAGMSQGAFWGRIKNGWDFEKALTEPIKKR